MYYLDLESDTKTSFGSDRESTMLFISHDSHMHARNIKKSRKEDMRIQRPLCCEKARNTVYTAHNSS